MRFLALSENRFTSLENVMSCLPCLVMPFVAARHPSAARLACLALICRTQSLRSMPRDACRASPRHASQRQTMPRLHCITRPRRVAPDRATHVLPALPCRSRPRSTSPLQASPCLHRLVSPRQTSPSHAYPHLACLAITDHAKTRRSSSRRALRCLPRIASAAYSPESGRILAVHLFL